VRKMVKTIKVSVDHDVRVFGYHRQYISRIYFSQNSFLSSTEAPESVSEEVTRLVNTFAKKIKAASCGYEAVMPENAALAVWYAAHYCKTPSEELDKIAKTGFSKQQIFIQSLGFNVSNDPKDIIRNGLKLIAENGSCCLNLSGFPRLELCLRSSLTTFLKFRVEDVDINLLKRVLNGRASKNEVETLKGIGLLGRRTQRKYIRLASEGTLTLDKLAKALLKSGLLTYYKEKQASVLNWFERNGFRKYASELVIKKTLVNK